MRISEKLRGQLNKLKRTSTKIEEKMLTGKVLTQKEVELLISDENSGGNIQYLEHSDCFCYFALQGKIFRIFFGGTYQELTCHAQKAEEVEKVPVTKSEYVLVNK